jgi:starvation-inducible DNA-binding protein
MNTFLRATKNHLHETVVERTTSLLNQQLADAIDLRLQAKQGYWNVRGSRIISLCLLCDVIAKEAEETVEVIAERIAQLGGTALGTKRTIMEASRLPEYPVQMTSGDEHLATLGRGLAIFVASSGAAAEMAGEAEDLVSADVLAEVSRVSNKLLWLIESYLGRLRPNVDEDGVIGIGREDGEDQTTWFDEGEAMKKLDRYVAIGR